MGFKEDFQREMRNVKSDVAKEVEKHWVFDFEGHKIEIINRMLDEVVLVDGAIIAENKRKSIWSHFIPYSTLKGNFVAASGKKHKVHVKLGGFTKLNCTVKVDGKVMLVDTLKLEFLPWKNKQPIVAYIESQINESGQLQTVDLPDDQYLFDENHPRIAPGLMDQLVNEPVLATYPKKLLKLFIAQLEQPSDQTRQATYEKIQEEHVISYFEHFLALYVETEIDKTKASREAVWLLEHAAHREVVKFALVILGTTDCDDYVERLKRIALHSEFTGVALFALMNGARNANEIVFDIAQRVEGWGKLETLNFLEASNETIRKWFIEHGVENTIRTSHAALLCAVKGKLDIELHESQITPELFNGASRIVLALSHNSELAADYEYTGQSFMRYCLHAKLHCQTLEHFYVIMCIHEYMVADEEKWGARYLSNWKPHEREAVVVAISEISKEMRWLDEAKQFLNEEPDHPWASDIVDFYQSLQKASV